MDDPLPRLADALQDRYRVEREIGQGGMATVYLAHDVRHNRKVAVKVLAAELAAMIGAERFLKEIEVTANLQHPHILPLFDSGIAQSGEGDGSRFLYYVMPFVEGDTLRDKLDREKELSVKEAVELTRSVAGALDYAHRHGVVHRDIKPENVLLHDGQAMVADFGIALAVREAGGTRLTGTGLSVGTPSYMSPEQAMGDREVDARSDIYSLGAMLYEMLTGSPPFTGNTAQAIVAKILTEPAPLITRARSSVPANVAAAIHQALERLPADRFATAAEFAAALANPGFTVQAVAGAGLASGGGRTAWNPLTLAAVFVAVVATVAAAWFATRPAPEAPVRRIAVSLPANAALADNVDRLAIAPDGSGFVYAGVDATGIARLMYRAFAQLDPIPLPGTEGGTSPAFSPDGSRIAFLAGAPFAIKVVALNGAPAITLETDEVLGGGVAWSVDDWIYFDTGNRLDRVRGSGGSREQVIVIDSASGEVGFAWPDPLPDGKGILFRSRRAGESAQSYVIKVLDLETRESRVLVQGVVARYAPTGHLLYVSAGGVLFAQRFDPDRMELSGAASPLTQGLGVGGFGAVDLALAPSGDLLYLSSSTSGGERFSWVGRDGVSRIVDPDWAISSETVRDFALSPDGRRLAVSIVGAGGGDLLSDIWIKELDDGPLTKLTFEHINRSPAWSPDGRTIYYASARADDPNVVFRLHRISADGIGSPEPLPADPRGADAVAVSSRDGWVVVGTGDGGARPADLLAFRPGIDSALMPLVETPAAEGLPALSPDGRWLAYTSVESGTPEVLIRPFPDVNRGKWQVSLDGGYRPRWSSDGNALFYNTPANRFVRAQVRTSPTLSVGPREVLHNLGPLDAYDVDGVGQRTLRLWAADQVDSTGSAQLILVQNFLATLRALK